MYRGSEYNFLLHFLVSSVVIYALFGLTYGGPLVEYTNDEKKGKFWYAINELDQGNVTAYIILDSTYVIKKKTPGAVLTQPPSEYVPYKPPVDEVFHVEFDVTHAKHKMQFGVFGPEPEAGEEAVQAFVSQIHGRCTGVSLFTTTIVEVVEAYRTVMTCDGSLDVLLDVGPGRAGNSATGQARFMAHGTSWIQWDVISAENATLPGLSTSPTLLSPRLIPSSPSILDV
eukprot:Filipodium_phascolosomae@DN2078_c0_g1_i2.p1